MPSPASGADPAAIARAAEDRLPARTAPASVDAAMIAPSVQRALFHAYQVARAAGSTYVDPEHLFFALVIGQDAPAGQVLARAGVTAESLTQGMRESVVPDGRCGRRAGARAAGCRGIRRPRCSTSSAPTSPPSPATAGSTR